MAKPVHFTNLQNLLFIYVPNKFSWFQPPSVRFGDRCPPESVDPPDPDPTAGARCNQQCSTLCPGGAGAICGEVYGGPIIPTTDSYAKICTCYCPPLPCFNPISLLIALKGVIILKKKILFFKLFKVWILCLKLWAWCCLKILLLCLLPWLWEPVKCFITEVWPAFDWVLYNRLSSYGYRS